MFEKVLKRLCPCYYNRKNAKPVSPATVDRTSDFKETTEGYTSASTLIRSSSTNTTTEYSWKGTVNLVQPQPVNAFPVDLNKSARKSRKNLQKPPLYWKKATKVLHPEGPPVFQEVKSKDVSYRPKNKPKRKKNTKGSNLKHSETVDDISSMAYPSTVEVKWLRSQSLNDINLDTKKNISSFKKDKKTQGVQKKAENTSAPCYVFPEISHGCIVLSAVYFDKKKTCLIHIDRLENLLRKGKDGHSYYSVLKMAILPSEKYIKCTKVLSNRSNPEVKQDFNFSLKELYGKVLRFSVFDASLQKQHEAIGHAFLTLDDIAWNHPRKYRLNLYRRSQPHISPGDLSVSLKYTENEDKLTIIVHKGKNLNLQKHKNVKLNTYVKAVLYSYGEKIKTKKSILVVDSRNPDYSSTFTFPVRKDQINHSSVIITVRLKGFVSDITIGRLHFGPFFYIDRETLTLWGRVFLNKEFVCYWFRMYL